MTLPDAFSLSRWFISPTVQPRTPPTLTQEWVGGIMTMWDAISYANNVVVGPITYQNLPVLSPSGLTEGTVLLARMPGSAQYVVMGMLGSARSGTILDPIRHARTRSDISLPNTTLIDVTGLSFMLKADTEYALEGCIFGTSTTACDFKFAFTGPPNMVAKWGMYGLNNATTSSVAQGVVTAYGDANTQVIQGADSIIEMRPGAWFATTDTPGPLQLRVALNSGSTAGILHRGSWLSLSELGSGTGTTTVTKIYTATASRSYDDAGNFIGAPDGDENVYQGTFPDRAFGNERSLIIFPGATIRTDLAGATILSAKLWLFCHKAEEAFGSIVEPRSEPDSVLPATYNPVDTSPDTSQHDQWTVNTWNYVECYYKAGGASLLNGILAGDNSIGLSWTLFGLGATGFRGYGFSANYRPYLEITYAI